jgi:hypothetical protein
MKLDKIIIVGFIFLVSVFAITGPEASSRPDGYVPLSSMLVQGAVNVEANSHRKGNALISLNFTLGDETNGIFPSTEIVEIGFRTQNESGTGEHCYIIHIPAHSFEKIKHSYEIFEGTSPADIGIRVLVADESTGEIIKDISDSLTSFHSIISPREYDTQYYLTIDAIFKHDNKKLMSLVPIGSSTKAVLIVGDDSGTTLANAIEFMQPN